MPNLRLYHILACLKETLSEVGRQVLAKNQNLISLKVVFLPQVKLFHYFFWLLYLSFLAETLSSLLLRCVLGWLLGLD